MSYNTTKNATKVFLPKKIATATAHILSFAGIEYNFANVQPVSNTSDFIIYTEETPFQHEEIKFNIAFISSDEPMEHISIQMESGGIIIVPEEKIIEYTKNEGEEAFKRVLSYPKKDFETHSNYTKISTEYGEIQLPENLSPIAKDFEGIKILVSQIGVYDDDFFDAFLAL